MELVQPPPSRFQKSECQFKDHGPKSFFLSAPTTFQAITTKAIGALHDSSAVSLPAPSTEAVDEFDGRLYFGGAARRVYVSISSLNDHEMIPSLFQRKPGIIIVPCTAQQKRSLSRRLSIHLAN